MHPTWTEQWWPISYEQDLDPNQPSRFTLLERDLVIWWDRAASSWRVFPDVCPHRLVPLSEGRINEEGLLECCLLYTSPSPRDRQKSRMPSSA